MSRAIVREAAAEFLGTAVLIAFGVGVVAQTVLSAGANGSYLGINLGGASQWCSACSSPAASRAPT